jgi:hypothetical protein
MRVNVYAEEMTDRIEIIGKEIDGHTFTGLRFYLELPATLPSGENYAAPFIHRPGDDDSAAVTFWGKRDLREVLRLAMNRLDVHYAPPAAPTAQDQSGEPLIVTLTAKDGSKVDVFGNNPTPTPAPDDLVRRLENPEGVVSRASVRLDMAEAAAEIVALRDANEAFGKRQDWWMEQMFQVEQRAERAEAEVARLTREHPAAELLWQVYEAIYGHRNAESIDPWTTAVKGTRAVVKHRDELRADNAKLRACVEAADAMRDCIPVDGVMRSWPEAAACARAFEAARAALGDKP